MTVVVNLKQLQEALRVSELVDAQLAEADPGDSVQIHLHEPEETVLRVTLFSNGSGQPVAAYTVDLGQSPGESGHATEVPFS